MLHFILFVIFELIDCDAVTTVALLVLIHVYSVFVISNKHLFMHHRLAYTFFVPHPMLH
jgi:hypothetical protein